MSRKKQTKPVSAQTKKLCKLIHKWAYMDSQKKPKEFRRLFEKIWGSYLERTQ